MIYHYHDDDEQIKKLFGGDMNKYSVVKSHLRPPLLCWMFTLFSSLEKGVVVRIYFLQAETSKHTTKIQNSEGELPQVTYYEFPEKLSPGVTVSLILTCPGVHPSRHDSHFAAS